MLPQLGKTEVENEGPAAKKRRRDEEVRAPRWYPAERGRSPRASEKGSGNRQTNWPSKDVGKGFPSWRLRFQAEAFTKDERGRLSDASNPLPDCYSNT